MNQIYQKFDLDLDLEKMIKLSEEERRRYNPESMEKIRGRLKQEGYTILEANEHVGGVPVSIIVGGKIGYGSIKECFYKATLELGLKHFRSSHFYTEHFYTEIPTITLKAGQ